VAVATVVWFNMRDLIRSITKLNMESI